MDIKNKAYELFNSGYSYGQIALELSISKSTAHNYVKELKSINLNKHQKNVQNSSDKGLIVRSEKRTNERKMKIECTGFELMNTEFIDYKFNGKFLELIGNPSKPFSAIIWGLPKGGKSNLSIRFADYLYEYFGSVCYFASEEGFSSTLKSKIVDIGGSNALFSNLRNKDKIREYLKENKFDFVFIDSINKACIDHEFLELLKVESPETSFIGIVQATKGGNFKGDQALTHNCDFEIKVVEGIAYHHGRFNQTGQLEIFKEDLYAKNPNKKAEKTLDTFKHEKEKTKPNSDITTEDIKPLSFGQIIGKIIAEDILKNNKRQAFIDSLKKFKL